MPYRELDESARRRLEARAALVRLAEQGRQRAEACERPLRPPLEGRRRPTTLPVAESAESPLRPYPRMTHELCIWVEVGPLAADDLELMRDAIHSLHPLFDTSHDGAQVVIEIASSKIEAPMDWIHAVIDVVLPAVHAVSPIRSVRYGRRPQNPTR